MTVARQSLNSGSIDEDQEGQLTNINTLHEILSQFPSIDYAFGYGSGVFQQSSSSPITQSKTFKSTKQSSSMPSTSASASTPMLDFIMAVEDSSQWHEMNMVQMGNAHHYASLPRIMGSHAIHQIQQYGSAGVYFNPLVEITHGNASTTPSATPTTTQIKYGVISMNRLKQDLKEWNSLYIAGRMQKPTLSLTHHDQIDELQQSYNLRYAVATALLLQSTYAKDVKEDIEKETLHPIADVYQTIASLSYLGDPRFAAGAEDPEKVSKLVHSPGQMNRFHELYQDEFRRLEYIGLLSLGHDDRTESKNGERMLQIGLKDVATRRALFQRLPPRLQHMTKASFPSSFSSTNQIKMEECQMKEEDISRSCHVLKEAIGQIVGPSSRIQSAKGLLTAGIYKSAIYAGAKLMKGVLRR